MQIDLVIVEDNHKLRRALISGLTNLGDLTVTFDCNSGEDAYEFCLARPPHVILMDVQLAGEMNGIDTAVALRREHPRLPIVFYSIQDDEDYYRAFRRAGILSHYAYVRKSNYLLPAMIRPLLQDAINGRSFIDPDIEARVQEVRHKDQHAPLDLLEPNEQQVARMLAQGMSNQQIAAKMGFRDKRTISRINGQIYTAWNLNNTAVDEKVARTRAALIMQSGRLIQWDEFGSPHILDERGKWVLWEGAG
ncbi:MAG: response regulator transcription factor [Anaerolineales bacterium]|nr:response regulator transcription factor [Anaerolineales bacterium]